MITDTKAKSGAGNERRGTMRRAILLAAVSFCWTSSVAAQFSTTTTLGRISTGPGDVTPDGVAGAPVGSPNGRYLVFHSTASNVVDNDTNFSRDVFLRDLSSDSTTRVSVNSSGVEGDSESRDPSISAIAPDGNFGVAFESFASNLDPLFLEDNDFGDVYLALPQVNRTDLVSRSFNGDLTDGESYSPSVAWIPNVNRALVVYVSDATNLIATDTNNQADVFLSTLTYQNLSSGSPTVNVSTERVTKALIDGEEPNDRSALPQISGNGKVVVYMSDATNLVSAATGGFSQIYAYDIAKGTTTLVSKSAAGDPGDGNSSSPTVSYNGRYVTYTTVALNISDATTLGRSHVIRYDLKNNVSELVNQNAAGDVGDGDAVDARVSSSGRFVVFSDDSSNLVSGDSGQIADVFIRDMETDSISRASVSVSGGNPNASSSNGDLIASGFNSDAGAVAFLSNATNLVINDSGGADVFSADGTIAAAPLTGDTALEVPPDVSVSGKRATLGFQDFSSVSADPLLSAGMFDALPAQGEDKIRYEYRMRGPGGRRITNSQKLAKRNTVTVKRLRPGNYNARYRVVTVRDGQRIRTTPYSPPQRFKIPRPS